MFTNLVLAPEIIKTRSSSRTRERYCIVPYWDTQLKSQASSLKSQGAVKARVLIKNMQVSENRSQLTSEGEDLDLDELVYLAEDTLLLDSLDSFTAPVVEALDQKAEKFGGESIGEVKKAPKGGRKPRKKDPKNAERCRQQREKRKQEKTLELKDNLRLKRERNEFLESIAELELEVQALRGQNAVDLAKENELLKFELEVSTRR